MNKLITIDVTQEDIAMGQPNRCRLCPVAIAISRAIGHPVSILEELDGILAVESAQWFEQLPVKAAWFVKRFDIGDSVQPFSFQISIPEEYVKVESR